MDALVIAWVDGLEALFFEMPRDGQRRQLRNTLETVADLTARNSILRKENERLTTELREQPTAYGGF
jgi:hypothetical protein